ncbi:hypothetical protein [Streptomyces sp. NBC_01803]|uniref:hypothetical protein n=1 Tax=Streptomyces sp. NBC_01803 TaxID=2975946 RepID=UPI002DD9F478|nr:hypothetical protein [Streptomyces sp. NBC_01803]WSA43612.1 hypothetical protein OIE51_04970 [Streptomyces sp. NBC_01803]
MRTASRAKEDRGADRARGAEDRGARVDAVQDQGDPVGRLLRVAASARWAVFTAAPNDINGTDCIIDGGVLKSA